MGLMSKELPPIPLITLEKDEGFILIEQEGQPLRDADINFDSVMGRSLLYLAGEARRLPPTKTRRPLITAISNLRKIFKDDPENPKILIGTAGREGLKYRLRADLEVFEGGDKRERNASYLRWKLFKPELVEGTPERTAMETAILSTLVDKLLTRQRLYFDDLHRSLNFIGLTETLPEGGIRIHLLTATQLKDHFQNTYSKLQGESQDPKFRSSWSEEDQKLWGNIQSLQNKLKAHSPTQLVRKVGVKLFTSEEEFYKSFPAETNVQFFERPYFDVEL